MRNPFLLAEKRFLLAQASRVGLSVSFPAPC
jgi:hypothetical protein